MFERLVNIFRGHLPPKVVGERQVRSLLFWKMIKRFPVVLKDDDKTPTPPTVSQEEVAEQTSEGGYNHVSSALFPTYLKKGGGLAIYFDRYPLLFSFPNARFFKFPPSRLRAFLFFSWLFDENVDWSFGREFRKIISWSFWVSMGVYFYFEFTFINIFSSLFSKKKRRLK